MQLFALLTLSLLSSSLFAASPVWKIQAGDNTLFLAGTIHILRADDFPLPAALDKAYRKSQRLVFETDIGQTQSAEFGRRLMLALRLPPDQTLDQTLSAVTLNKLRRHMQQNGMNFEALKHFKPSMIAMSLTLNELNRLGVGETGVDVFYFGRAKKDQKPASDLETPQQQLEFLVLMGQGAEEEMILQTLDEIDSLKSEFPQMIESWKDGDMAQMEKQFVEPMKQQFETMYQQLLVKRNQAWMPQIEAFLQTPETEMVLVGSAHLLGSDGLLIQLEKAGYTVTQLD
jgi:uncharacterized protein YbaP (TraB family)